MYKRQDYGRKARNSPIDLRPVRIVADGSISYNTIHKGTVMEPLIMGQTSLKNSRLEENMTSFMENKELVAMTIILLLLSILCKFITGIFLNSLIKEAENMSATENKILKQCKIKFRNCYKLNDGVPNIPVFVDKFINRIQIGKFSMDGLSHFAGQLMMLSVFFAGAGDVYKRQTQRFR